MHSMAFFPTALTLLVLALGGCATHPTLPAAQRPAHWAQPVQHTATPGALRNFFQVSPQLYRAAQPSAASLSGLNPPGQPLIRTVVNLRPWHTDASLPQAQAVPTLLQVPVFTSVPDTRQVLAFLRIATDPQRQPVLVHCLHGSDRTGLMVASYRVVVQDWQKTDAIAEMTQGGFGYHPYWRNLIDVLEQLDVPALRQQLSLPAQITPVRPQP